VGLMVAHCLTYWRYQADSSGSPAVLGTWFKFGVIFRQKTSGAFIPESDFFLFAACARVRRMATSAAQWA